MKYLSNLLSLPHTARRVIATLAAASVAGIGITEAVAGSSPGTALAADTAATEPEASLDAFVAELAARADTAHGNFYRHFKDKDALLAAGREQRGQRLAERHG